MNLQPIMSLTQGTLFRDLQDFVRDGIVAHMDEIVYRSESPAVVACRRKHTQHSLSLSALRSGCTYIRGLVKQGSKRQKPPELLRTFPQHYCGDDSAAAPRARECLFPVTSTASLKGGVTQEYVNEKNLEIIEVVAQGMAELTGQYQNFSFIGKYMPFLWVAFTW